MGFGALLSPDKYSASDVNWFNRLIMDDETFLNNATNVNLAKTNASRQLAEGKLSREDYTGQLLDIQSMNLPSILLKPEFDPSKAFVTGALSPLWDATNAAKGVALTAFDATVTRPLDSLKENVSEVAQTTAKSVLIVLGIGILIFLSFTWIVTRRGVSVSI